MNLFEYIAAMKEQNSTVAMVGVILLALFLVVIILKMLGGMRRGTWRQLVRTGMTLLSAIASFIVADTMSSSIIGSIDEKKIEDLVTGVSTVNPDIAKTLQDIFASIDPQLIETFVLLPAAIVVIPLIATVVFLAINLVLKIVRAIIVKIFRFKKSENNTQRLGGILLAAVEGIIWIIMITLPFTGVLSLVDDAYNKTVETGSSNIDEIEDMYEDYISPFTSSPAFEFTGKLGSRMLSDKIATVTINDEKVNLREETSSIAAIIISEAPKFKDLSFTDLTRDNKKTLNTIVDGLCDSQFASNIIVCGLQSVSALIDNGMVPIDTEGDFAALADGLVEFFKSITIDTLREDVETLKAVYYALSDNGILRYLETSGGDILSHIQESQKNGDDIIDKIITILQKNTRTAKLVKDITKSVISSIATNVELEDGTTVTITYDSLKNSMENVISVDRDDYDTSVEYKEALKETLDEELTDQGIELDDEVLDSVTEYIDDNYSDMDDLTDEEFTDIMLHYYETYLNYLETGEVPEDLLN